MTSTQHLITDPILFAHRALRMLSEEQRDNLDVLAFCELSEQIVVRWSEDWPEDQGFGAQDSTPVSSIIGWLSWLLNIHLTI